MFQFCARGPSPSVEQRGPKARATPRPSEHTAYGDHVGHRVSATLLAGARHCSTNDHRRWSSSEGRRLERRRDPASPWRTATTSLTGSRRRSSLALVTARPTTTAVGRAARAEGSSDAETQRAHGVRRPRHSPGLGDAPRWRSSLLDQRPPPLVEQRGPKARATPRPSEHTAYGDHVGHRVSATLLAGARHCSTNDHRRWSSSEGRRLERRRDPASPWRTATTSLTGSRRRSSLALVTARPTTTAVGRAARAEGSSDAETQRAHGVRRPRRSPGLGDAPR
ncbi:hypothetical protein JOE61_004199 [Nocardioides salarius]|uniref:Uncharacterized protein n=1 Tax=Nocardioides salarius TaxID=374513 RepID=A0ABS2MGR9_9ACTN|nr:hypothetical protein [Nocardioides salarius]